MAIVTHGRPDTVQSLSLTTSPSTSAAFGTQSNKFRAVATAAVTISIGNASGMLLPANAAEVFDCSPGQRITAAAVTGTATLNITEII
jgi:hypothetical protein